MIEHVAVEDQKIDLISKISRGPNGGIHSRMGIGNMIDRVLLGYVVDFLEFTFIDFPVFNVADSFVCIGAALMILYLLIDTVKEYRNGRKQKTDTADVKRDGDEA